MGNSMKRGISGLRIAGFFALLFLAVFLGSYVLAEGEAGGSVLTWELEEGVLTISGQGPMTNYDGNNAPPWDLRKAEITVIDIKSGVTSIGSYAFYGCKNLTDIQIPAGIKSIGNDAFAYCKTTGDIILPDGLETIGSYAFFYAQFGRLVMPNTVTSIGSSAFYCAIGTEYTISSGLTEISSQCFDELSVETIRIPEGIKTIGWSAFAVSSRLKTIYLPASLESIQSQAFYNCGITDVYFAGTQEQANALQIGTDNDPIASAWWHYPDNTVIKGIGAMSGTCGEDLTWEIDDGVLIIRGEGPMTDFDVPPWDSRKAEITAIDIKSGVTSIGSYAFYGCKNLTDIQIPAGIKSIGNDAFAYCKTTGDIILPDGLETIGSCAFFYAQFGRLVMPNTVTSIGSSAFYCAIGTEYTISSGLTEISSQCFDELSVETIRIPEGIKTIGWSAFAVSSRLKTIYLPASLESIQSQAFYNCGITDVYFAGTQEQANALQIGTDNDPIASAWWHYPDNTVIKGIGAMSGTCGEDLTWEIDDGVLIIRGEGPMTDFDVPPWDSRKAEITAIDIKSGVTSIGSYAFYGCKNLTDIQIPAGIKSIGNDAFAYCKTTGDIILPDGLETIGSCAFFYARFGRLVMPNTVTSIGSSGFFCAIGTEYTISSGLTEISSQCFDELSVETIRIPEGIKTIGWSAFAVSSRLTTVYLPASLESIQSQAFYNCGITDVYFAGTPAQAQAIRIGTENIPIGSAKWHFPDGSESNGIGATSGTCGSNVTWNVSSGKLTITGDGELAEFTTLNPAPWTAYKEDIITLEIGEGVTTIPDGAFRGMKILANLSLPLSLESIGEDAFAECTALEEGEVDYAGSEEMAKMLPIGNGNEYLVRAHWHYRMNNEGELESAVCWELNGGALRIYGSGRMPDYNTLFAVPWHASMDTITSVSIGDGVINIGNCLFYGCRNLTSVTIADSVTSIGSSAFSGCTALQEITIPQKVTSIGNSAFYGCTSLSSITLPTGKISFGSNAFRGCSALTRITLPEGMTDIPYGLMWNTGLTSVTIPAKVRTISDSAFAFCGALTTVTIPESTDTIGYNAFADTALTKVIYTGEMADAACINLARGNDKLVEVPWQCLDRTGVFPLARSGVLTTGLSWELDSNGKLTVSGSGVIPEYSENSPAPWYYLRGEVIQIEIGEGVRSIGREAFQRMTEVTALTLAEGLVTIREYAFEGCSALATVALPATLRYLDESAFNGCPARAGIHWPGNDMHDTEPEPQEEIEISHITWSMSGGTLTISGSGKMPEGERDWLNQDESITAVVITDGVTAISESAFRNCATLTSITIPGSVNTIGYNAFGGCTGLTGVSYGGTEEEAAKLVIGLNNKPLINAAWTYSGGAIGSYPTANEGILSPDFEWSLDFNGTLVVSGKGAMPDCDSSFHAPWNKYASKIRNLIIEDGVKTIGAYTFTDFSNLTNVTIPSSVTSIGDGAFINNPKLTTLTIPASVKTIGYETFRNSGLTSITIPDSVVRIGDYAFENCRQLTMLNLGKGLKEIPYGLCDRASALKSITIPDNVKRICGDAFWYSSGLESISLPGGLKEIQYDAFGGCSSLSTVTFRGTEEQAAGIRIATGNEKLTDAAWSFTEGSGAVYPTVTGGRLTDTITWGVNDGVLTITGSGAMPNFSSGKPAPWYPIRESIRGITVDTGITYIGSYAFYRLTEVTEVTLPAAVTQIGNSAFANTRKLTALTIPENVKYIGSSAFAGSGLTSVTIPNTVTWMGWGAFSNCTDLTQATIGTGLNELNGDLFWACRNLTTINIPDGVAIIRNDAFGACYKLESVSLPETVTAIESGAFGSTALTNVFFRGTREKAAAMSIASGNTKLTEAKWHFTDADEEDYPAQTSGALTATILWQIEGNILTISGRGAMPFFYEDSTMPWQAYAGSIEKVVVGDGIRTVGNLAFRNMKALATVELADTVTTIGEYAFYGDSSLKGILLPAGMTTILESAFGHTGLESICLPDSVTTMGNNVFEQCDALAQVRLSAGMARIPYGLFGYSDALERIVIPEGITAIGSEAFCGCSKLAYVELPASLTFIETNAFSGCGRLALVRYHDTEDASFYLEIDSGNAPLTDAEWQYLIPNPIDSLTNVLQLPAGVKAIEASAFEKTSAQAVIIPNGTETIGEMAFANSPALQYVQIPESVKQIPDNVFLNSGNVTIVCAEGGNIEAWAEGKGIPSIGLW